MQVEVEVCRLEELKSSKLLELVLKKRAELDEICRKTHLVPELDHEIVNFMEAIDSGSCYLHVEFIRYIMLICCPQS